MGGPTNKVQDALASILDMSPSSSSIRPAGQKPPKAIGDTQPDGGATGASAGAGSRKRASSGGSDGGKVQRFSAIEVSENVALQCRQTTERLGNDDGIYATLPKPTDALKAKLEQRLEPRFLKMYGEGWEEGMTLSIGMALQHELQRHAKSISSVCATVTGFHDKTIEAHRLYDAIVSLEKDGIKLSIKAYEEMVRRKCQLSTTDFDWTVLAGALGADSKYLEKYIARLKPIIQNATQISAGASDTDTYESALSPEASADIALSTETSKLVASCVRATYESFFERVKVRSPSTTDRNPNAVAEGPHYLAADCGRLIDLCGTFRTVVGPTSLGEMNADIDTMTKLARVALN